jgi:hypothetical protein
VITRRRTDLTNGLGIDTSMAAATRIQPNVGEGQIQSPTGNLRRAVLRDMREEGGGDSIKTGRLRQVDQAGLIGMDWLEPVE